MELVDKAEILSDCWMRYRYDPEMELFMQQNDLGMPYAFGIASGDIVDISTNGEGMVLETFDNLLQFASKPEGEYSTLDQIIDNENLE
jgi:hypothetical protein